jgi:hypothetical protein
MNERLSPAAARAFVEEHRRLDAFFGRFLAFAAREDIEGARRAIEEFDAGLRHHMAAEDDVLQEPLSHKLASPPEESAAAQLGRELRVEHVQIREVSGMILRLLSEKRDLAEARVLAGNLARRWDAHTGREERNLFARVEGSSS